MTRAALVGLTAVLCAMGCSGSPSLTYPRGQTRTPDDRPRLVVVIVIDQLGSWMLDRYLPYLSSKGAFKTGIASGAYHTTVSYLHAGTFTAPGHAATYTGVAPAHNGVCANVRWDRVHNRLMHVVDDRKHYWLSDSHSFSSPAVLRVSTVADVLLNVTHNKAQVASLAFKDYAAVIAGGRNSSLTLWFDPNGDSAGFTTSSYYAEYLPDWLVPWLVHHSPESYIRQWDVYNEDLMERVNGPDEGVGETGFAGFGTTFPHDPRKTNQPLVAFTATPEANEYLFDLAWESIQRLGMGNDSIPDLLMVSVSATDFIGHHYGAESWEYFDMLLRLDSVLAKFVARIKAYTFAAFILTSDHGAAPMPERLLAEGQLAGRIDVASLKTEIDQALDKVKGEGDWVAAIEPPFIYLANSIHRDKQRAESIQVVVDTLVKKPFIEAALDISNTGQWRNVGSKLKYPVGLSVADDLGADVYMLPKPYYVFDSNIQHGGTNHGTLWPYDRDVPVIMWGTGVQPAHSRERMDQRRVPVSIATLLGIQLPALKQMPPLAGVSPLH